MAASLSRSWPQHSYEVGAFEVGRRYRSWVKGGVSPDVERTPALDELRSSAGPSAALPQSPWSERDPPAAPHCPERAPCCREVVTRPAGAITCSERCFFVGRLGRMMAVMTCSKHEDHVHTHRSEEQR